MSFHINSNLSPTEAVKMHPELQVHPVIEKWAADSEELENVKDTVRDVAIEARSSVSEDFMDGVEDLVRELNVRGENTRIVKEMLDHLEAIRTQAVQAAEYQNEKLNELLRVIG